MEKNLKITLFFLSIIISILITTITYFGLDRYYTLQKDCSDKYIDNYKNLTKLDDKIIISLSATDSNLENLRPMLNSLLDQTIRVDKIILNLPPLSSGQTYTIPENYKKFLTRKNLLKDYGYGNNIIPTLLDEKNTDTKIIYLENNNIYGKDFIQKLVEESNKYPDNPIGVRDHTQEYSNLVKPKFFEGTVASSDSSTVYDKNWIDSHLKTNKIYMNYIENYIYN
jgi:hypothetical protein